MNLTQIPKGESVEIISIIENDYMLRLYEMGCLPGELITISHIAPLNGPLAIQILGYTLSLRTDEAKSILVKRLKSN